jgi:hypothetical protein
MIDTLIGKLKIALDGVKDHRKAAENLQHSLGDILMAALLCSISKIRRY